MDERSAAGAQVENGQGNKEHVGEHALHVGGHASGINMEHVGGHASGTDMEHVGGHASRSDSSSCIGGHTRRM